MKTLALTIFIQCLYFSFAAFGQSKYFENKLSNLFAANVNDDLSCIILDTDSTFVVTGRYSTSNDYSTYTSYLVIWTLTKIGQPLFIMNLIVF